MPADAWEVEAGRPPGNQRVRTDIGPDTEQEWGSGVSQLTLTVLRFLLLAVLWLFVLSVVSVVRSDLFGTRAARAEAAGLAAAGKRADRRAARRPRGAPRTVVVIDGPDTGMSASLDAEPVVFGRGADATLALSDDYVSTMHARLFPLDGHWYVEDLGSTNGTYLDGARVRVPTPVPVGTPLRVGKTVVEVRA